MITVMLVAMFKGEKEKKKKAVDEWLRELRYL